MPSYPRNVDFLKHETDEENEIITIEFIARGLKPVAVIRLPLGVIPEPRHVKLGVSLTFSDVSKNDVLYYTQLVHQTLNVYINIDSRFVSQEKLIETRQNEVKTDAMERILKSDWTQLYDVSNDMQELWKTYRTEVMNVYTQPTFPHYILWPTPPDSTDRFALFP